MIYIKKRIDDISIKIKLDENSVFYTNCGECGKLVEATEDILEDFTGFLFGKHTYLLRKVRGQEKVGLIRCPTTQTARSLSAI